jgi:hypothetical protein
MIPRFLFTLNFSRKFCLIVFPLALITASVVSGRAWFKSLEDVLSSAPAPNSQALNVPQSETRPDRVEAEVITVLPSGFQPSEITRPRGQFLILVDNQSGFDDVTLRLSKVAGQRLRELKQTEKEKVMRQLEDLPPGEYQLTAAEHPDWVCRITITN